MKTSLLEKLLEKALENETSGGETSVKQEPFEIGKAYLIRTVTYHQIGILKEIIGDFLIFKDVDDSGRTVVHYRACPFIGTDNFLRCENPVLCAKRHQAASMRTGIILKDTKLHL